MWFAQSMEIIVAILTFELAKSAKGSLAEREDWWNLCMDTETGELWIEHAWDHVDAYNVSKVNRGTSRHSVDGWTGPGSKNIEAGIAKLKEQALSTGT